MQTGLQHAFASLRLACAVGAATIAGCGTSMSFVPINDASALAVPKTPEQVEVFASRPPPRPFIEIGLIEANQESGFSHADAEEILRKMRAYAAERGCDGLVLTGSADRVESLPFSDQVDTIKGYRGVCIVYTQPGKAVAQSGSQPVLYR